jgi:hypothetical protein
MRELGSQLAQWLLAQGVSEDACGARLATKWLPSTAELGPPRGAPAAQTETVRSAKHLAPSRHRGWALLPALAISLVSGGLAWADSAPDLRLRPSERMATTSLIVAAPAPAAPPQAQVQPAVFAAVAASPARVTKPKTQPLPRRAVPAPRLPF